MADEWVRKTNQQWRYYATNSAYGAHAVNVLANFNWLVEPVRSNPDGNISIDLEHMVPRSWYPCRYHGREVLAMTPDGERVEFYRVKHPGRLLRWIQRRTIGRGVKS